jgi:Uma2 family endonuclease
MLMGMNQHRQRTRTTQAAEGLPRWRWTAAEIEEMTQAGVFGEHDRFELIGGEIVPMSPKGSRHEILRSGLAHRLSRLCPPSLWVTSEPQFNLDADLYTVPDILVHPAEILVPHVRGPTAVLVIEIADTSLSYDLEVKAPLYAAAGVREYWVINAIKATTTVHRDPSGSEYGSRCDMPADQILTPAAAPALIVRLSDLSLG